MRKHLPYIVLGTMASAIVAGDFLFPHGIHPSPYALAPRQARIEAVVCSEPQPVRGAWQADVRLADGTRLRLTASDDNAMPRVGDVLTADARTRPTGSRALDADPEARHSRYLRHRGIDATAYTRRIANHGMSPGITLPERLLRRRKTLVAGYRSHFGAEPAAVLAAMTLGDRTLLTAGHRQTYALAGSSHILALSGLHLGVMVALLYLLLMPLRMHRLGHLPTIAALLACCWAFVLVAGMPLSLVRAATMLTVCLLMTALNHYVPSTASVALAVSAVLLCSPGALFDVGFQLSAIAVAAVIAATRFASGFPYAISLPYGIKFPWLRHTYNLRHRNGPSRVLRVLCAAALPVAKYAGGLLVASAAAVAATTPLVLHTFGMVSTVGTLAALVAVPTALLMVCAGLAHALCPSLHAVLVPATEALYGLQRATLGFLAGHPWACLRLRLTAVGMVAAYAALLWLAAKPWWRTLRGWCRALALIPLVWLAELAARCLAHALQLPL